MKGRAERSGQIGLAERHDRASGRHDLAMDALSDVLLCGEIAASFCKLVGKRLNALQARQNLFRVRQQHDHYAALSERDHT
jgi:hypothetical protein